MQHLLFLRKGKVQEKPEKPAEETNETQATQETQATEETQATQTNKRARPRPEIPNRISFSDCFKVAVDDVWDLWEGTRIPIITKDGVRMKMKRLVDRYRDIMKNPAFYMENEWSKLFVLAHCKCSVEPNASCGCPPGKQIPIELRAFYIDQNGPRSLSLNFVPSPSRTFRSTVASSEPFSIPSTSAGYVPAASDIEEFESTQMQQNYSPNVEDVPQIETNIKKISLPTFCAALDRADVSSRFGALLATTLLKDLNIQNIIIDQHKIQRERVKARAAALDARKCDGLLECISFDGKKDKSLVQVLIDGKPRNIFGTEEHITIVKEPGSYFISYVTPAIATGGAIAMKMFDYLEENDISLEHLVAVGCDGTSVNTGKRSGAIASMEGYLEHPLQWLVCLFHFNELPFTALLKKMLGKASEPRNWPGVIGELLRNCEKIPVRSIYFIHS